MEREFLSRMGINPNVMKKPLEYLQEDSGPSKKDSDKPFTPNDGDIFNNKSEDTSEPCNQGEENIKVSITDPAIIQHERFLRSIGIDISKLSISQVQQINNVGDPSKLTPEDTRNFFKSLGVDVARLMEVVKKRTEEGHDPFAYDGKVDICVKVGRNDKCPCGSEKKFKKCCEQI